jgi:hypothetical protein
MWSRRRVTQVSAAAILIISICWIAWTGQRMVTIGEFASDHGTSGYPGAGTWFGFLAALIIGLASLTTMIVLAENGRRQH